MNRRRATAQQRLGVEYYLGEVLVRHGLAGLVPLKQRGRSSKWLRLTLLLLGFAGWVGLPLYGFALGLILAITVEALAYYQERSGSLFGALLRPSLSGRIRPFFYWPLALSAAVVAFRHAELPLVASLLRGAYVWLCFRVTADLAQHPERYASWAHFSSWSKRLGQHSSRVVNAWAKFTLVGVLIAVVLNLSAPGIWQSLGHTAWNRLLLFGGALHLTAIIVFIALLRSMIRSSVSDAMDRWDGIRVADLDKELGSVQPIPGIALTPIGSTNLVEARLEWKNQDNLKARVGLLLEAALARRYRWTSLFASSSTLVLAALLIAMSAFLLIPRDVMARWASTGEAQEAEIVLALDDLRDLFAREYWSRFQELDGSDLAAEPVLKVAFLEAIVIISLFMFETSAGPLMAELDPAELRRWLTLGTTYLALLEGEFQYLYSGFITRSLTGAVAFSTVSMRNEVLLVPSAKRKVGVYRGVCDFLQVYKVPEWAVAPYVITVFENYHVAQEWALRFLRFSTEVRDGPYDLDRAGSQGPEIAPERCWIWYGHRLIALSSFAEARRYARFVALYNGSNGRNRSGH